jgi:predicted RNA-binding Zn-ribbon protein involved in translation (DUF1610 family)
VGTVFVWLIVIAVGLMVLTALLNSMNKSIQKIKGHNRCVACKSRLKAANGVYATTCRKCGKVQPWVKAVEVQRTASPVSPVPGKASVADELAKLAQLRDSGALSDEEFATQKAKLLAD